MRPSKHKMTLCSLLLQLITIALLNAFMCKFAYAEFLVSIRAPETLEDTREAYSFELIKLVMDKTKTKYGDYRLQLIPAMNRPRARYAAKLKIYPNLLLEESYDKEFSEKGDLTYINFPVELGILGHRICFVNPKIKEDLKKVTSVEQLKKYSMGQGIGWIDTNILRANGFRVSEIPSYPGLFKMTAAGRVDLFCRGANEIKGEYEAFKYITELTYDETFALTYALPRFYYTNSENTLLIARVQEGLVTSYKDGSLKNLWLKYQTANLDFVKLHQRKMFTLTNPFIADLPKDYEQYVFDKNIVK
jgi:hypothetical protein